ncbi:MAG TPA: NAD(P)-binding protein [Solirubrobacteraceae bacterium]|nr:NAD(P)-binding protein [Solirubrobacteraceae bacterium]
MTASTSAHVLILGDAGGFGEALARRLEQVGARATMEAAVSDSVAASRLAEPPWTALAILTHDDALALRLTLLAAQLRPDLPMWVSVFDRTIVHQLHEIAPSVNVVVTADLVAQELADECERLGARRGTASRSGVRIVDDALRLMVGTGAALFLTLALQTVTSLVALHETLINAVYFSTRSLATVADSPGASASPTWFKLTSTLTTLVSVVMVAIFTAALVRRLSRPRLTTLFGSRRVPSRQHVLLVGFGQIGFRLAQALRTRGIPVVALERRDDAPCVRLARRAGIPVAIGRGDDREILELLGLRRCAVVAAVTSDDLANVSIGLAANDVRPEVPIVLRLGDGDVAAETESLLHLGRICDAHALIARTLADELTAAAAGRPAPAGRELREPEGARVSDLAAAARGSDGAPSRAEPVPTPPSSAGGPPDGPA